MSTDTPEQPQEQAVPSALINQMQGLGFEFHNGEYHKCFTKNEGTCELTIDGAIELMTSFDRLIAINRLEAGIAEFDHLPYAGVVKYDLRNGRTISALDRKADLQKQLDTLKGGV